mmetsp:Transcript_28767/g.76833  ORF Transcript_28767/g.76833 Transcript_28767/m.76833 type:complete len:200 (-) Transcript_28767:543-1142(-)
MSSSSLRIRGSLKKDSANSSTLLQTCERIWEYTFSTSSCTESTASSTFCGSVGISYSHVVTSLSMEFLLFSSSGTRSFVVSRSGRRTSSSSSPIDAVVFLRKTHGLANVAWSVLLNRSTNIFNCRSTTLSKVSNTNFLIVWLSSINCACLVKFTLKSFSSGDPFRPFMNCTIGSFCCMKNHLTRSPTYMMRRCSGRCAL